MRYRFSILSLILVCSLAQFPAGAFQSAGDGTVVATIDGREVTAGELESFFTTIPPAMQQSFMNNKREFLERYALFLKVANMAEQAKLAERSPYKERIQTARRQILMQAQMDHTLTSKSILPEEQRKFYDDNKDRYTQAKAKVIYIPYGTAGSGSAASAKVLSEKDALLKAQDLVKQIRAGADFVKLVKEHSKDPGSVAKDGDMGIIRRSDEFPEPIKTAIFSLKKGEVGDPVKLPNGFYILRVEEVTVEPFEKVRDAIYQEIQQSVLKNWLEATRKELQIKIVNDSFFASGQQPAPAPAKQPAPPAAKPPVSPAK